MKYEVKGPDGSTFTVEGPEGATDAEVIAQVQQSAAAPKRLSADGEADYASFAANPSNDAPALKGYAKDHGITLRDADVDAFIKARNGGSRVSKRVVYDNLPKAPPSSIAQTVGAAAGKVLDGAIPGSSRFIRGVKGAVGNAVSAAAGSEDFDPSAGFQQGQDEQDYAQALLEKQNPNVSAIASTAGLVGSLALPELRPFRSPRLLAGAGNAALTGAGYGALTGALNDSGDGRIANTLLGAGAGGAIAAGFTGAIRGAGSVASAARRNIPGTDATARFLENLPRRVNGRPLAQPGEAAAAQGERILAQELDGATIATGMGTGTQAATPPNIQAEVARRQALGVPAVPADVTEPGRRITSWALQGNGPSTTRARNMLMARQAGQGQRIRGHITDEMGLAVDPIRAVADINRRASAEAAPLYEEAYALPMAVTPEIEEIARTPAFRQAVPTAVRNIRNAQRNPQAMGFRDRRIPGEEPEFDLPAERVRTLSTEGFDQVIRAMRDNASEAMDNTGFRPRDTTNSVHINARARDLRRALGEQNGPYQEVTSRYADAMDVRSSLENGQEVSKLSGPEIAAQMEDMRAPNAREAWMTGARTTLADNATQSGLKPTANVAQSTRQSLGLSGAGRSAAVGDQGKQQAIEAMSNNPGVIDRLDGRLEAEDQAYKTFHSSFGGSPTQPRQAIDEALSGQSLNVAAKAARGDVMGAVGSLLFQGNPRGAFAFKRDVQDRIADLMTATNPQDVAEAMQAIMRRAQTDADFAHSLNRAGIKPAKIAAAYAAAQDTDAEPEDPVIAGPNYTKP